MTDTEKEIKRTAFEALYALDNHIDALVDHAFAEQPEDYKDHSRKDMFDYISSYFEGCQRVRNQLFVDSKGYVQEETV